MANRMTPTPLAELSGEAGVAYKLIPGYVWYAAGDDGSIWSCLAKGFHNAKFCQWKRLGLFPTRDGYLLAYLATNGKIRPRSVHVIILETFVGPKPPGMETRHFPDRTRTNNRLSNLSWGTRSQNQFDRVKHAIERGEATGRHKVSMQQVRDIRRLRRLRMTCPKIAKQFGVSLQLVKLISSGRTWKGVE